MEVCPRRDMRSEFRSPETRALSKRRTRPRENQNQICEDAASATQCASSAKFLSRHGGDARQQGEASLNRRPPTIAYTARVQLRG